MTQIKLPFNKSIGINDPPFIIAEIGNNHNGDLELAFELIRKAKKCGVDAVKFQVKDIESSFSKELLDKTYDNENSFGSTYREHKEALEFSKKQLKEIYDYSEELKILCFSTPFDIKSIKLLEELDNPIYKISSFHVTDLKLIEEICKTQKPIIISSGMSTLDELDKAINLIKSYTKKFALLHCVSSYPTNDQDLNLNVIPTLKNRYDCIIGYSGHERGTVLCTSTILLGSRIIERHFTLDRYMKGPDHASSLEPDGMSLVVKRAKRTFVALGSTEKNVLDSELNNRKKFRGY
jgi:N-acetylneuraminate synthase/sialic acid synthase